MNQQGNQQGNQRNVVQERKFGELFEPRFDRFTGNPQQEDVGYQIPPHLISLILNGYIF